MPYDRMKSRTATKTAKETNKKPTGMKTTLDKTMASFIVPMGKGNKKRK